MINKVNFTGNMYFVPSLLENSKASEIRRMQRYTQTHDVDVFVYGKKDYADEVGAYDAVIAKDGKIWLKTFDMKHSSRSLLWEIPGQDTANKLAGFHDDKGGLKTVKEEEVFKEIDVIAQKLRIFSFK